MKKMEELLKKINAFTKLAKQRKLTKVEWAKREETREQYRKLFREGFEQKLKSLRQKKEDK